MMLVLLLLACDPTPTPATLMVSPPADSGAAALTDDTPDDGGDDPDDGGAETGDAETGGADDTDVGADYGTYSPSYELCVSDAECAPGDACTTVSGYSGKYCAPACDPAGDGGECQLDGLDFETTCTEFGRCARVCGEDPPCPDELSCQSVGEEELCAGEPAGGSGYYGTCSHPNVDGPDCPEDAACWGGDLVGVETGICLPWCPDYTCPDPPAGVDAYPICYDIGLGSPTCALLCDPETGSCPDGQECYDAGSIGACVPIGATSPY